MAARRWLAELVAAACALYLGLALLPSVGGALPAGLEASWIWAVNWLPRSAYLFGRDVVFAYGPLGYLAAPYDLGRNLMAAQAAQLALHAVFTVAAWRFFRRAHPLAALCATAMLVAGASFSITSDYRMLLAMAFLAAWLLDSPSVALAALCALLAAALLFVKLSTGAAACALFLFALRPPLRVIVAGLVTFALAIAALGQLTLGSVLHLEPYILGGAELALGYSAAMSQQGPALQLWLAVGALAALLPLALLWLRSGEGTAVRALALLAVPLFLAFKEGFVRQDARAAAFFGFVLCAVALAAAHAEALRGAGVALGAAVVFSALAIGGTLRIWVPRTAYQLLTTEQGRQNLRVLADLSAQPAAASLSASRLPDEWLREIRDTGGTVDAIPGDLSGFIEAGLRWAPPPLLQSRFAYTSALDERQAAHYRGDRAADFLVVAIESGAGNQGRHALLESPRAWLAIRERYEVAARHPDGRRLLLRRRKVAREALYLPQAREFTTPALGFRVPPRMQEAVASLQLPLLLRGKLAAIAYRVPPISINFKYADDSESASRLLIGNMDEALPLGDLPRSAAELANWIEGEPAAPVREVHLSGPGLIYCSEVLGIVWSNPAGQRKR